MSYIFVQVQKTKPMTDTRDHQFVFYLQLFKLVSLNQSCSLFPTLTKFVAKTILKLFFSVVLWMATSQSVEWLVHHFCPE